MSSSIASSKPAFNKTRWGDISKLTHAKYDEWKDDMILILSAMKAYAIITGDDPELQPLVFDHNDNYNDCRTKEAKGASIIRLSCSPEVRRIVKGMRNPHEMWNTLQTRLGTTRSYIGRQDILHQFLACRPKEDESPEAYFTKLSHYRTQQDHTHNAITDGDVRMQIFTSLPLPYTMIFMVLKHRRPLPTHEDAMHDLLEEETTIDLTKELGVASTGAALFSQRGGCHGRESGG
jgi:hypothetical protein